MNLKIHKHDVQCRRWTWCFHLHRTKAASEPPLILGHYNRFIQFSVISNNWTELSELIGTEPQHKCHTQSFWQRPVYPEMLEKVRWGVNRSRVICILSVAKCNYQLFIFEAQQVKYHPQSVHKASDKIY